MIGIYKITSPTRKVYIGQSIDIKKRFTKYKRFDCKKQIKLYNSLIKHGLNNHVFEAIEECEISELNDKERYYQDFYNATGNMGLNCRLTGSLDKVGNLSEDHKNKIRLSMLGRKKTREEIIRMSITRKGIKKSDETKKNMSLSAKKRTKETQDKINLSMNKKVIDIKNNKIYNSTKEVAELFKINRGTLRNKLCGNKKNNTNFKYL